MVDNATIVRNLIDEVWNKGNLDACDQFIASDAVTYDPLGGKMLGIESFRNHVRALRAAYPDLKITAVDVDAIGDKVYVRWMSHGTHKGPLAGIPPTNVEGGIEGVTVSRLANGKVVEAHYEWDMLTLLQQAGLIPKLDKLVQQQPSADVRP